MKSSCPRRLTREVSMENMEDTTSFSSRWRVLCQENWLHASHRLRINPHNLILEVMAGTGGSPVRQMLWVPMFMNTARLIPAVQKRQVTSSKPSVASNSNTRMKYTEAVSRTSQPQAKKILFAKNSGVQLV